MTISLGGVELRGFEVPEAIAVAGEQRLATNTLIGGGQVVNVLGYGPDEITFEGIFAGADAAARAQSIDELRVAGASVPLVWEDFFFIVVISQFVIDYKKPWWIPFQLRCAVVADTAEASAAVLPPIATLVENDVTAALTYAVRANLAALAVDATSGGSIASAQMAVSAGMSASGAQILASTRVLNGAPDASTGIGAVVGVQLSSGALAGAAAMSGYFSRAASNFASSLF